MAFILLAPPRILHDVAPHLPGQYSGPILCLTAEFSEWAKENTPKWYAVYRSDIPHVAFDTEEDVVLAKLRWGFR